MVCHDAEGVGNLYPSPEWCYAVVLGPGRGEVHQRPLARIPLVPEDEHVGTTDDHPALLPALGLLLEDVEVALLGDDGAHPDLLDVGQEAGGGGGRGGGLTIGRVTSEKIWQIFQYQ